MLRKLGKFFSIAVLATGLLAAAVLFLPRLITEAYAQSRLYSVADAPAQSVAIVFGAGLTRSGQPSAVLRDRIRTAVELYENGKVAILLMSGDNTSEFYDEPGAMKNYAMRLGVPAEAIVADYAGRRTYDTCYRAGEIFGVNQAILVTQSFHLPRAVFTCNLLGTQSVGVPARESRYWRGGLTFWTIREIPATLGAFWDVFFARPIPILGEPEPIQLEAN